MYFIFLFVKEYKKKKCIELIIKSNNNGKLILFLFTQNLVFK